MASLYTHQAQNTRRSWMIMAAFLAIVGALGYVASLYTGSYAPFYVALVFSVVMNASSFWFSDTVALKASHAKEADLDEYRDIHNMVENLAITAGLPKPRVYVIEDSAPNAFATGRNQQHAAIAVTTGLLQRLEKVEIEGVLAHELAHIGNRDILVMSMAVMLVGVVAIITDMLWRVSFMGGDRDRQIHPAVMIVGLVLVVLAPVIAQLMQFAISRRREFVADATGALLTRYPEGLASALEKIGGYSAPMKHASSATAHLFIGNPFGNSKKFFVKIMSTHPPMEERIAALRGM